jgi:hypothetical protein
VKVLKRRSIEWVRKMTKNNNKGIKIKFKLNGKKHDVAPLISIYSCLIPFPFCQDYS